MELQCAYCGRPNSTQATHCLECGTKLVEPVTQEKEPSVPELPPPAAEISETEWRARDAWKCLGMFLAFEMVVSLAHGAVSTLSPGFRHWSHSGYGHFLFAGVHYTIDILTMLYFARIGSKEVFLRTLRLAQPPSRYIWAGVVFTLAIRMAGHLMYLAGWAKSLTSSDAWGFRHTLGPERYLFLAPSLMAPFCEELYMRGFLYRAFRGSYSIYLSTLLIVAVVSLTHSNQFYHSWVAAVDLSALTVLQCFLRERGNLRDCIASHLVFNLTWAAGLIRYS
jgi:membrane protease YdiL (CAAX protease family)